MEISRFFYFNTCLDSIFHHNGIPLYILPYVELFNNNIKYCTKLSSIIPTNQPAWSMHIVMKYKSSIEIL